MGRATRRAGPVVLGILLAMVAAPASAGHSTGPAVVLFGRAGTFGTLATATRLGSGHSFGARPVAGWGLTPGQSFFYADAGKGEVLFATYPQSGNAIYPTADHMALSVFRRDSDTFRNITVPTSNGSLSATNPWTNPPGVVGGADVSDVQLVRTPDGTEKLAFLSAFPYHLWSIAEKGLYPALGFLRRVNGQWVYDAAASRSAQQLQDQNGAAGRDAFPTREGPYGLGEPTASTRGFSEMAFTPRSGHLVVTQYLGDSSLGQRNGRIVVLGLDGSLKASYLLPNVPDPAGGTWHVSPKFVEADPSARLGDERFVVQYDAYYTNAAGVTTWHYPIQEFAYNAATRAIRPVTAALEGTGYADGSELGYANYDRRGNLWVGTKVPGGYGISAGPVVAYTKVAGRRSYETGPCAVPADFPRRGWQVSCTPDVKVGGGGHEGYPQAIVEDSVGGPGGARKGTIYAVTVTGSVVPIVPTYSGDGRLIGGVRKPVLALDLEPLRAAQPGRSVNARKGYIDGAGRSLWIPVATTSDDPQARVPSTLPQWAYRVDLDKTY